MPLDDVNPFPLADPSSDGRLADAAEGRREVPLLTLAWRGRWLMLLLMIVGGGMGWALLQRAVPRYTSMSRIFVERTTPRILDEQYQAVPSASYLFTQAELIRSSSVLSAAAEMPENANLSSFRGIESRVGFLRKHIQVEVGANDDIINISAELPNAKDAAQIVSSVVDAYITMYAEQHHNNAVEVLTILRSEKLRRDAELQQRREALDEFRRQHPELAVEVSDGNVVTLRFAALSTELNSTEIELLQSKALYNRVKKMFDAPSQRPHLLDMAGSEQSTLRDLELERQVKLLQQELVGERAQWGEGHPRVKLLNESLSEMRDELKKKQAAIIEGYVESLRQNYELLDNKRSELQAAYDRQFAAASRVSVLVDQVESLQSALTKAEVECDNVEKRIKEVNLNEEVGAMNVNIVEPAGVTTDPTYPQRARFLGLGLTAGALCGLGLAWLRNLLDHRLRSIDEIAEVLNLPVLGILPYIGAARDAPHVGRLVAHAPRSAIAEAVRTLRTALHFGLAGHEAKTLAVTSPSPGDGKSTVASNVAIAMAQADQRVLLIDADLRKPTQHLVFEVSSQRGLASALADRCPVDEAIVPTGIDSLDLLPCGPLPANPVELLNNGYFAELLDELKQRYDKIVIDSPPVMPVADARVIAAICDSTLLVLRAERSARRISVAARNELWRVRAKRLGVVVNGVPVRQQGSYGYGYDYGSMAGQYGGYVPADSATRLPAKQRKKSRALSAPQPAQAVGEES